MPPGRRARRGTRHPSRGARQRWCARRPAPGGAQRRDWRRGFPIASEASAEAVRWGASLGRYRDSGGVGVAGAVASEGYEGAIPPQGKGGTPLPNHVALSEAAAAGGGRNFQPAAPCAVPTQARTLSSFSPPSTEPHNSGVGGSVDFRLVGHLFLEKRCG